MLLNSLHSILYIDYKFFLHIYDLMGKELLYLSRLSLMLMENCDPN